MFRTFPGRPATPACPATLARPDPSPCLRRSQLDVVKRVVGSAGGTPGGSIGGGGDSGDKCRVLLERLKMVDHEKSALVLENEAQRTHYERCLDDIAGQVIQALLAQKVSGS